METGSWAGIIDDMSSDAWGFAIAGGVALSVLKKVVGARASSSATPEFPELVTQAKELGLDGLSLREGLRGDLGGMPTEFWLGSHTLSRVGSAGSVDSKMLVVEVKAKGLGAWWIASANLATRTTDALPAVGDVRRSEGGSFRLSGSPPSDDTTLMQALEDSGLELASSNDEALLVKFAVYPSGSLELEGRVNSLLSTVRQLSAAS